MMLRARKGMLVLLTTALLVVSAGCPNSNVILSGNGTAQFTINVTNFSRFELGVFGIDRILVRPVDSGANSALGDGLDINLLQFAIAVDLNMASVDPLFFPPNNLSQGTYEVVAIDLSQITFLDFDVPDPSTCESFQSFYSPNLAPNIPIKVDSFSTPLRFTIERGTDTPVTMTFDATEMVSTLFDAYTCSPSFVLSDFDEDQFIADTGNYLTFE